MFLFFIIFILNSTKLEVYADETFISFETNFFSSLFFSDNLIEISKQNINIDFIKILNDYIKIGFGENIKIKLFYKTDFYKFSSIFNIYFYQNYFEKINNKDILFILDQFYISFIFNNFISEFGILPNYSINLYSLDIFSPVKLRTLLNSNYNNSLNNFAFNFILTYNLFKQNIKIIFFDFNNFIIYSKSSLTNLNFAFNYFTVWDNIFKHFRTGFEIKLNLLINIIISYQYHYFKNRVNSLENIKKGYELLLSFYYNLDNTTLNFQILNTDLNYTNEEFHKIYFYLISNNKENINRNILITKDDIIFIISIDYNPDPFLFLKIGTFTDKELSKYILFTIINLNLLNQLKLELNFSFYPKFDPNLIDQFFISHPFYLITGILIKINF
ncbi:MAG: hypothetical protein N3A58_09010 [Spirochaetes bacterium]|nr:hypothetical protein [Spirochaetota bacterium]